MILFLWREEYCSSHLPSFTGGRPGNGETAGTPVSSYSSPFPAGTDDHPMATRILTTFRLIATHVKS
jgi:hypothetical protein